MAELPSKAVESKQAEEPEPEGPPDTERATAETDAPAEEPEADESDAQAATALDAEFYAQQIPGTDLTYGEFKDRVKDLTALEQAKADFESESNQFRTEKLRISRDVQLAQAAGMIPKLTPQQRAQLGQMEQEYRGQQAQLTLQAIPGWSDQASAIKDVTEIADSLKDYGMTRDEVVNWIETDARIAKLFYDRLTDQRKLAAAQAKVKTATEKRSKSPTHAPKAKGQKARFDAIANNPATSKDDRALAILLGASIE